MLSFKGRKYMVCLGNDKYFWYNLGKVHEKGCD